MLALAHDLPSRAQQHGDLGNNIGNAYLEAKTKEKVFIVAGPKFGERQEHTLVIHKMLYGLKMSGVSWNERCSACLRKLGFTLCKAEPNIWMRRVDDQYQYIGVYVDDLAIVSHYCLGKGLQV